MNRLVLLFIFIMASLQASADDDIHVFSNGRIIDDVSDCSIESFNRSLIHVSSSSSSNVPNYENLRSRASRRARIIGRVPVGSLISLRSQSVAPGQRGYISMKMASRSAPRSNFGSLVSTTAEGHIWGPSVDVPDKWVFKIVDSDIRNESGTDATYLNNKYLRVVKSGSNYRGVRCCEGSRCKNLVMYSVSPNLDGSEVENFVAIHPSEMSFIQVMQGTEANNRGTTRSPRLANNTNSSSSSSTIRPAQRPSRPATPSTSGGSTTPVRVHSGSMEKVVCTRSASLNVRNENLRRVLFSVRKYESVTPYESWSSNRVTRGSHTYVRVRFPRLNREGWVAEQYVKVGTDCAGYTGTSGRPSATNGPTPSSSTPTASNRATQVVCTRGNSLNVRNSSLNSVIFQAPKYARVSRIGTSSRNGRGHTFINVRFPDMNREGWVAQSFIAAGNRCRGYTGQNPSAPVTPNRRLGTGEMSPVTSSDNNFVFPLYARPTRSYTGNVGTAFGARRSSGRRKHAATDLKRPVGDRIRAVSDGEVIRFAYFYSGTYAMEVRHNNGEIVRYGEMARRPEVRPGNRVSKGQVIGRVGRLNSGNSMLHFELYTGHRRGSLTTRGNRYMRRSDLVNPTRRVQHWQRQTLQ